MRRAYFALAIMACALCVSCGPSSGFHAWFFDSLIKVFPQGAAGTHRLVFPEFAAARNWHPHGNPADRH